MSGAASTEAANAGVVSKVALSRGSGRTMNLIGLAFGAAFGAVLGATNLHEYDTIHNMLALRELDVFFFMGSAIAVSAPLLWLLERRGVATPLGGQMSLSRSKPEAHHLKGGAIFGAGWAIAGTCPAPALVLVSSGAWMGLVSMAGIFLGLQLRQWQQAARLVSGHGAVVAVAAGDGEHRDLDLIKQR